MIMVERAVELAPGVQYVPLLDAVLIDALEVWDRVGEIGPTGDPEAWVEWYARERRRCHWPAAKYLLQVCAAGQLRVL